MSMELRRHRSVMFQAIFPTRHSVLNVLGLYSSHLLVTSLEVQAHCLHNGKLAPHSSSQLRNPDSTVGRRLEKDLVIFLFLLFPVLQALLDLVFMPRFRGGIVFPALHF